MRIFVKENSAKGFGGVRGGRNMNPTIEKSDRLKRETMGMSPHVGRTAVEYDTEGFEGLHPDRRGHFQAGLSQKTENLSRVVARYFPESRVDLDMKMFAAYPLQPKRAREGVWIGEFALIRNRGDALRCKLSPGFVLGTGDIEKQAKMSLRAIEAPASPSEQREIPMGFRITRIEAKHATQSGIGPRDLAPI